MFPCARSLSFLKVEHSHILCNLRTYTTWLCWQCNKLPSSTRSGKDYIFLEIQHCSLLGERQFLNNGYFPATTQQRNVLVFHCMERHRVKLYISVVILYILCAAFPWQTMSNVAHNDIRKVSLKDPATFEGDPPEITQHKSLNKHTYIWTGQTSHISNSTVRSNSSLTTHATT